MVLNVKILLLEKNKLELKVLCNYIVVDEYVLVVIIYD